MGSKDTSFGTSWADQWDSKENPTANDPSASDTAKKGGDGGGGKSKYSKKVEEGLGKTKAAAVTGMKKAKLGASLSFGWIKQKV
ncbi:hypothetical protein Pint_23083 [Pistacia integerrima]|uniref:Uncharacterized protein n=1 Tax=Pistacia integerrima TaxID=434235 RepID=A0ACC0YMX9_9ROSI|nr:hypothetical protein Pint_23083 [Pistacia integerrima]